MNSPSHKSSPFLIAAEGYSLNPLPDGQWHLKSPSGTTYVLNPKAGTCTCRDFKTRGHKRACKHVKAIWDLLKLMPWLEVAASAHCEETKCCT